MTDNAGRHNEAQRLALTAGRAEDVSAFDELTHEQAVMLVQSGVDVYMLLGDPEKAYRAYPVRLVPGSFTWKALREGTLLNRRLFVRRQP